MTATLAEEATAVATFYSMYRRSPTGDVEPDQLGRGGQGLNTAHPAPAGEVGPVLGIGLQRVLRSCLGVGGNLKAA